ncbi:GIY-YIG nuclease family protein [Pseudopontixanthobacter vadosimaris]|uniref:GIY-YIG nuclease family protein n=1 Tax=Pseudopontixanthobacter vadosimaris TaxID=2726450 RepID=UPI00197BE41D|nr:GIY-YIG nuclease family protein [Pseudopontixanthobacter vadosimaris]
MMDTERKEIDSPEVAGYVEFEFDLPKALLHRLIEVFDEISAAALSVTNVNEIPDEQGVYQLFLDGALVYVGKTDGEAGLRSRLSRHATKLLHRHSLSADKVSYKAVRVFVFTAMDLEGDLIRHYGGVKMLSWNGSGFGSNDPGKERDTTKVKLTNFDAQFPIDIDREIHFPIDADESAASILARLKSLLPYTLRFEMSGPKGRKPHADLEVTIPGSLNGPATARTVLAHILSVLPSGWKATALPGYIIMYKNDARIIPSGLVVATAP